MLLISDTTFLSSSAHISPAATVPSPSLGKQWDCVDSVNNSATRRKPDTSLRRLYLRKVERLNKTWKVAITEWEREINVYPQLRGAKE